jgi:molybdate transport system substrate-binding protein
MARRPLAAVMCRVDTPLATRVRRVAVTVLACATAAALSGCTAGADRTSHDAAAVGPLVIAAASDLVPAFTQLGARFEVATGVPVVFDFGSSGRLAQQAIAGAPFDLYASASAAYVDRVLSAGVGDPSTRATYAVGRLVAWSRTDRWGGWASLDELLDDRSVTTIAIANPEHAPYGLAARQALETLGRWDATRERLVYGDNVADTQRVASTGDADVALVALSLAIAADERGEGRWLLLPAELHATLRQDLVVVATDPARADLARRFAALVASDEGREVMRRYGFVLPGEDPDAR